MYIVFLESSPTLFIDFSTALQVDQYIAFSMLYGVKVLCVFAYSGSGIHESCVITIFRSLAMIPNFVWENNNCSACIKIIRRLIFVIWIYGLLLFPRWICSALEAKRLDLHRIQKACIWSHSDAIFVENNLCLRDLHYFSQCTSYAEWIQCNTLSSASLLVMT